MYQVIVSDYERNVILRPEVEAADAIYWVNRISELGCQADVVRTDGVQPISQQPAAAQVAVMG